MSNNWYDSENWYSPHDSTELSEKTEYKSEARRKTKAKKDYKRKGLTPWRIVGIICLLLILITGTSLAVPSSGSSVSAFGREEKSGELPDSFSDFFDTYYQDVQTDVAEVNIPKVEKRESFVLELSEAENNEMTLQEIYRNCSESIVAISGSAEGMTGYNWGTGIILSSDGLILTNTHVIDGCDKSTVTLFDDTEYEAKLVGADSISDIAVLKIEASGLRAAQFGQSADLVVGDRVAAIGNPLGEEFRMTLTDGIISAIERGISYNGHSMTLLQTNTAINEGNSGGALFNMYGQVIGITNMKMMSAYSSIEGIGFAIPSATVRTVVDALVRDGEVRGRPSVGITIGEIPQNISSHYELPSGVYVYSVTADSYAEKSGIKSGDIITQANYNPVSTPDDVAAIKNELQVGDIIIFTVWRDGETTDVEVILMDTNDIYGGENHSEN